MIDHDLVVVGGGPAGYAAALYGASCGLDVGLVEKDKLGGTCLHSGCIPAKELLETAAVFQTVRSASEFGITSSEPNSEPTIDMGALATRKHQVVSKLAKGLEASIKGRGISVYSGVGALAGSGKVSISNIGSKKKTEELAAKNIIVAAGSTPRQLPGLEVDGKNVITSDHILSDDFWNRKEPPKSIAIVGAGAVGVEFASFFSDIGSQVLMVEAMEEILPGVDDDIVKAIKKSFTKRGIQIATGTKVSGYDAESSLLSYGEENFAAEVVVLCVGRRPFVDLLGDLSNAAQANNGQSDTSAGEENFLDADGFVAVNENLQTNLPGVYAVGDLINTPQLAHTGFAEGIFVVRHCLGENPPLLDYEKMPWGIYCRPEIAFVGLSEKSALAAGYEIEVSKHSFVANGRAQIMGETEGMIKVVAEKETKTLLGVHLVGPWVTEQLGAGYLAVNWEASATDIAEYIFPHPTLSEMFSEAALALTGRPLHG